MKKKFSLIAFASLVLGIVFGIFFKEKAYTVEFIGTYYIKILKIMITPILFTSIAYSVHQASSKSNSIIIRCILTFVLMFVATFILTSILVWIINPSENYIINDTAWDGSITSFNLGTFLLNLLPKNLSDVFVNPKVFFIIVVAFVFGKLVKNEKVFEIIAKIKEAISKALEYIICVSPVAIFALIYNTVANNGAILLGVGLKYILTAYICAVFTLVLIMMVPVCIKCNISFKEYFLKISKIWMMTFTTCSSNATLPFTVKVCQEDLDIPKEVTDVVVPLGCTIHMCGGAVSFALLGLFSAKMYGVSINIWTYLLMIISSLLINMAAPGIPNGGIVIGATYLSLLQIPLNFIGFYAGIYKILDMCYTTLNVTGDISANMLINNHLSK